MGVNTINKDREHRDPTIKKTDSVTVLKTSFQGWTTMRTPCLHIRVKSHSYLGDCRISWWSSSICVWSFFGSLSDMSSSLMSTNPSSLSSRSRETSKYVFWGQTLVKTSCFKLVNYLQFSKGATPCFLYQHHLHETLWFMISETIRPLLRHSPIIPKSCRGGQLREAAIWSLLSCSVLWAGKFTRSYVASTFC